MVFLFEKPSDIVKTFVEFYVADPNLCHYHDVHHDVISCVRF